MHGGNQSRSRSIAGAAESGFNAARVISYLTARRPWIDATVGASGCVDETTTYVGNVLENVSGGTADHHSSRWLRWTAVALASSDGINRAVGHAQCSPSGPDEQCRCPNRGDVFPSAV